MKIISLIHCVLLSALLLSSCSKKEPETIPLELNGDKIHLYDPASGEEFDSATLSILRGNGGYTLTLEKAGVDPENPDTSL